MASELDFIPTKSSALKRKAAESFQAVVYEKYKPKGKVKPKLSNDLETEEQPTIKELDMKRVRHEVIRFGMSGFTANKKEEAKVELALKLGAKPPKRKAKNYKELLTEKKNKKETELKNALLAQLGKNSVGKSTAKGKSFDRKRRKLKDGILNEYGKPTLKKDRRK